jgi:hypothetical protein
MDIDAHEHPRDSHALLKTEIWADSCLPAGIDAPGNLSTS